MKKNSRRWFVFQGFALLFGLVMSMSSPAAANAGSCGWGTPCGEATNNSKWTMQVTTTLGYGPHYCDVWNWNGGGAAVWKHAKCTQQALGPWGHKGGGNVDVDAFTFNDRDYSLNFHGKWLWKTKGVWTKIQNHEGVTCHTNVQFNYPVCYVTYEA